MRCHPHWRRMLGGGRRVGPACRQPGCPAGGARRRRPAARPSSLSRGQRGAPAGGAPPRGARP
eukprot:2064399-Alexandrium_andersonii.AAC.1